MIQKYSDLLIFWKLPFRQQLSWTNFGLWKSHSDIFLRGTSISLFGNKRKSCAHTLDQILNLDNYCYRSIYLRRSYPWSLYSLKQRRHYSTMKKYFFVQKLLQPILAKNLLPTKARNIEQPLNTFKKNNVMKNISLDRVYSMD